MPQAVAGPSENDPAVRGISPSGLFRRAGNVKVAAVLLSLAALFVLGRTVEVDAHLRTVQEWVWGFGVWGPVAYVLLFVASTLLLLPATPLTILAPFLFGTFPGYLTVMAATTAASVSGFFIARTFGRRTAEEKLGRTEVFRKIRRMVEKNRRIAIPFVRLMPMLPFAMNDYALGLTRISFWSYFLYSELVFIPMNAVMVLGARAIYAAIVRGEVSWWLIGISAGAGIAVLAAAILLKRLLRGEEKG